MTQEVSLEEVGAVYSAEEINSNFSEIEEVLNVKADLNGETTEKFNVADAVESTEAVNKGQLDNAVSAINDDISALETDLATKADAATTYTKTEVDSALAAKVDVSDTTVTKQGNTFNGAGQLVQLSASGQLPALDGSLITGAMVPTLDTSNMQTLANNSTTPNTQIDFSAGYCWDDALTKKIVSTAMTKRLDATFTVGSGNGGLDTGLKADNTWYHCFAIAKNDGTSDFLFSTSVSNPTMPTDYIYKRRLGSIKTDGSSNIVKFLQVHETFLWDSGFTDLNKTSGFSTSFQNLTVSTPLGVVTEGLFGIEIYVSQYGMGFALSSKLCTNNGFAAECKGTDTTNYSDGSIMVDTLSQIKYSSNSTYFHYANVYCRGYRDFRGIR